MSKKWGGVPDAGRCWFVFKYQEPVNGNVAYAFQYAGGNPGPPECYIKYIGLESLLDGLREEVQMPCILVLNHFLASEYPQGTDELAELSQTEVNELEALLKTKEIDDIKLEHWEVEGR